MAAGPRPSAEEPPPRPLADEVAGALSTPRAENTTSLSRRARVEAWVDMGEFGAVRRHRDGRFYIDFGPTRRVWSLRVGDGRIAFDERLARRDSGRLRGEDANTERRAWKFALEQLRRPRARPVLTSRALGSAPMPASAVRILFSRECIGWR